jgi:hypothetical protein
MHITVQRMSPLPDPIEAEMAHLLDAVEEESARVDAFDATLAAWGGVYFDAVPHEPFAPHVTASARNSGPNSTSGAGYWCCSAFPDSMRLSAAGWDGWDWPDGNFGFLAPVLARHSPAVLDSISQYSPVVIINGLAAVLFMIGYVLFGVAMIKTAALPRWAGVLVAVGAPAHLLSFGIAQLVTTAAWPIAILGSVCRRRARLGGLSALAETDGFGCGWFR